MVSLQRCPACGLSHYGHLGEPALARCVGCAAGLPSAEALERVQRRLLCRRLACDGDAPSRARAAVREVLAARDDDARAEEIAVLVSELVTNRLRYAEGDWIELDV